MKKRSSRALVSGLALTVPVLAATSVPVFAQDEDQILEETVTIGTRGKPRSATDSPAPVDVISGDDFLNQGGIDTSSLLRNVVPSFNVNDQPISDAATLVRPPNLRGLAPDHTLVLVNGQRRHRAAVIAWLGNGISDGSQGPDIGAIPSIALKSVEILRDGAAAQYGSDAIAGVLNFGLKDSDSEGSIQLKYGQYSEGDGDLITVAVNKGFALGTDGFFNVSAEWSEQDATDRSVQRDDAAALIAAGFQNVGDPAQVWGTPEVKGDMKLWLNWAKALNDNMELFGHANYNTKEVTGGFYYRNPTNRGGVYSGDGGATLLIGDLTPGPLGQDNSAFPGIANGDGIDCPQNVTNVAQVAGLANCFNFQELITGGFTPNFGGDVTDTSFHIGLRGETNAGMFWKVSGYYGLNEADFFINNTVNASLGPQTPRDFNPGAYEQEETGLNVDFSMPLSDTVNLAFGAEYRSEEFTIVAGQTESYIDGGLGNQGFSTSTNGFPGFSPEIAGSFDRTNYAVYVDGEWDATDNLLLTAAARFEDFEDFGTTTNFKLGGNLAVSDTVGFRSTISTGFKAPTPGQSNASNISTQIIQGVLTNQGVIPSISPVAQQVGGTPLDAEESFNYTFGVYFTAGIVDVTVDYFNIEVDDRLSLSSDFALTPAQQAALQGQGIDASDISQFRFFTNQFDTETKGVDIVVSFTTEGLGGQTTWNWAHNWTDTNITRRDPTLLNDNRVRLIENGVPGVRSNFSATHVVGDWRLTARASYYGKYYDNEAGEEFPGQQENFDAAWLFDLEGSYAISDNLNVTLGGRNVGDEQGCSTSECGATPPGALGLPYSQFTPFGFNGAFYYGRVSYDF